jgi:hypothetical protein
MTDVAGQEMFVRWARERGLKIDESRLRELQPLVEARLLEIETLWDLSLGDVEMPLAFARPEDDHG